MIEEVVIKYYDEYTSEALLDGERLNLSQRETSLLESMLLSPGVISPEEIMDYMYGHEDNCPYMDIINVFMHKLRGKLGQKLIVQNVKGRGYIIENKPRIILKNGRLPDDVSVNLPYGTRDTRLNVPQEGA